MLSRLEHLASPHTAASRVPPAQLLEMIQLWGKLHANLYAGSADGSVARTMPNFELFWRRYVAVTNTIRRLSENGTIGRRTQANATINGLGFGAVGPVVDPATYQHLQRVRVEIQGPPHVTAHRRSPRTGFLVRHTKTLYVVHFLVRNAAGEVQAEERKFTRGRVTGGNGTEVQPGDREQSRMQRMVRAYYMITNLDELP